MGEALVGTSRPAESGLEITSGLAWAVHRHVNERYYRAILQALNAGLREHGFELRHQPNPATIVTVPADIIARVGLSVAECRLRHLCPRLTSSAASLSAQVSEEEDGFGAAWAETLLNGLADIGVRPVAITASVARELPKAVTVTPAAVATSESGLFVVPGSHDDTARKLVIVGDVARALPDGRAAWNLLGGLPTISTTDRPEWGPQEFAEHASRLGRPVVFLELLDDAGASAACAIAAVTTVVACIHSMPGDDGVRERLANLGCTPGTLDAVYRGIVEANRKVA